LAYVASLALGKRADNRVSGIRAALIGRGGSLGPRTVLEGKHGFFNAFAPSGKPDFSLLLDGPGGRWLMPDIAFKPYACGTMTQSYIDWRNAESVQINTIVCKVGEGTVHRLWEPQACPPTPYTATFSTPFCMAVAFFDRCAGLGQFTESRIHDPAILGLACKSRYEIDPENEYRPISPVICARHSMTDRARADPEPHARRVPRASSGW